MKREKNERIKTIILALLITLSLFQTGILWGFVQHSFPFNFFTALLSFSTAAFNDKDIRSTYFKPARIAGSEGNYPGAHWEVEPDTDIYQRLWKEAELLLKTAFKSKPDSSTSGLESIKWSDIVKKKSVVFEFSHNINIKLFAWLLDISDFSPDFLSGIYKVAILPDEDLNNNMTLYISDNIKTVKFTIPPQQISRSKYNEILTKLSSDPNAIKYNTTSELFSGAASMRDDLLLVWDARKSFDTAESVLPGALRVSNSKELSVRNSLAQVILGNNHTYDSDVDKYGGIVYVNENNIYKIYNDGYFVYTYRNYLADSSKASIVDSFRNAVEYLKDFCDKFGISSESLILSNATEEKDYYRFIFNYTVNGLPVEVDYIPEGQEEPLKGSVSIEANSRRVTSCKWLIRDIQSKKEAYLYNISFQSLANESAKKGYSLLRPGSPFVEDIYAAYPLTAVESHEVDLTPVWVVKLREKGNLIIPMGTNKESK